MVLKFNLIINEQERDGFKLSVQADSQKELEIAKELSNNLINKITKIEIKINNYEGDM